MTAEITREYLLEYANRRGDSELIKKIAWLNDNNIELSEWQLIKFTGFDRGIGKTYVSMLLNTYHDTGNPYLDPDAHRNERATRDYLRQLKEFKKQFQSS